MLNIQTLDDPDVQQKMLLTLISLVKATLDLFQAEILPPGITATKTSPPKPAVYVHP